MSVLVKNYAEALFLVAEDENKVEKINAEMFELIKIFAANKGLGELLQLPSLKKNEKMKIIDNVFLGNCDIMIVNFLKILIEKNRIILISEINDEYFSMYKKHIGVKDAVCYYFKELSDLEKTQIITRIEKKYDFELHMTYIEDPTLIGGLKIIIDNNLILDNSITTKLKNMKESLYKTTI